MIRRYKTRLLNVYITVCTRLNSSCVCVCVPEDGVMSTRGAWSDEGKEGKGIPWHGTRCRCSFTSYNICDTVIKVTVMAV